MRVNEATSKGLKMNMTKRSAQVVAAVALMGLVAGCGIETDEDTTRRAGTGAAAGAVAGAAVGILSGGFLAKTIAGAAIGGAGGFLYDQAQRENESK